MQGSRQSRAKDVVLYGGVMDVLLLWPRLTGVVEVKVVGGRCGACSSFSAGQAWHGTVEDLRGAWSVGAAARDCLHGWSVVPSVARV